MVDVAAGSEMFWRYYYIYSFFLVLEMSSGAWVMRTEVTVSCVSVTLEGKFLQVTRSVSVDLR